jgi:hypothetical protein
MIDDLVLSVVLDSTNKRIVGSLRNVGKAQLKIGNLTLANLKFSTDERSGLPVTTWISTHLPNADGVRTLQPMESAEYEYDYLREFAFPAAGKYSFWLIYDSLGFKDRFFGGDGPHADLHTLNEIRRQSSENDVVVSESDYEYNRKHLRKLAM